jgi:4-hydroxybenzoyl-CoA thioesterase
VLEITGRFLKSATYGEPLHVDAILDSWQNKTFRVKYVGRRNDDLLFEGHDVRVWAVRGPDGKLKAMPIPDEFRAALGAPVPPQPLDGA